MPQNDVIVHFYADKSALYNKTGYFILNQSKVINDDMYLE